MTFRARLTIGMLAAALLPIAIFGIGVRREMAARLNRQADRQVDALVNVLRADLTTEVRDTRARLGALAHQLAADTRFRLAVESGPSADRRWLLDWAVEAMRGTGLAMLQVQDSAGRIVSSGHFRNDFDRLDPRLPRALAAARATGAVVRARLADGVLQALAGVDSLTVGGRRYTIVGARALDSVRLANLSPNSEIGVVLVIGDSAARARLPACGAAVLPRCAVAELALPYFDDSADGPGRSARFLVTRDSGPIEALRRSVDRWLLLALGVTLVAALGLATWFAGRIARPITELADKTARVDLDRLDQEFATDRDDEIGALARLLDAMTSRLRSGAARLRETERRATVGDLSRQINHDIKNGLAPIRHVVRHLTEIAERQPDQLAAIFGERRATLESSVEYLDGLARNYAKLSPALDRSSSDPNAILREIAAANGAAHAVIELRLAEPMPPVRADPLVLRRILENLVGNAVDALDGRPGRVILSSAAADAPNGRRACLTVADSGRGMGPEELDRSFDDFYTTKAAGTGLGLSVVRRLVTDLGGSVRAETMPGQGSTFTVEIPTA
ncbi:MAG: HAMP domain-containing sensor histidine kinase [Gemmatimonadota bacterium]